MRWYLSILLLLIGHGVQATSCVLVERSDGRMTAGIRARCTDGSTLGVVDAWGQLCLPSSCDTILIDAPGLVPMRIAWAQALRDGRITLLERPAPLAELQVAPWPARSDRRALAAYTAPDSTLLAGFERSSLRSALLWVPGVQMDQRGHGGSTRLSIRGSLLRAPYGVRGVKVYWGPFTLTRADGSTPLELLDPELVGSMEVVRSIGGPLYGTAPSGLVLADAPWRTLPGASLLFSAMGGSYGYSKLALSAQFRQADGSALTVGVWRLGSDGYRQQESARRDQVFLSSQWRQKKSVTRTYLTLQRASWDLPGSIDSTSAQGEPRAARPYSRAIDAHIDKTQFLAGVSHEMDLFPWLRLRSVVQAGSTDKKNPYGTTPQASGDKKEHTRTAAARLALAGQTQRGAVLLAWETGLEALADNDELQEWTFPNGIRGAMRTDADATVRNLNGFITTRTRIAERTTVFADLGLERTAFTLEDHLLNTDHDRSSPVTTYPVVGISRQLDDRWNLHVRYAETLSRPTVWELLGAGGVLNTTLQGEGVQEWEAGVGRIAEKLRMELTGYLRRTDGLILSRTTDGGSEEFYNAGLAEQNGVEASIILDRPSVNGHRLSVIANGAWQHHRLQLPDAASRTPVPGVPEWTTGLIARCLFRWQGLLEAGVRTTSSIPVTTDGSVHVPAYAVVHVRLEHPFRFRSGRLTALLRIENLMDTRYTSFLQLNDPGGRYYNPAPGRSYFAGLSFALHHTPDLVPAP